MRDCNCIYHMVREQWERERKRENLDGNLSVSLIFCKFFPRGHCVQDSKIEGIFFNKHVEYNSAKAFFLAKLYLFWCHWRASLLAQMRRILSYVLDAVSRHASLVHYPMNTCFSADTFSFLCFCILPSDPTNGDTIPPILAKHDDDPTPTERTTVG